MPELDGDREITELFASARQHRRRVLGGPDPRCELKKDGAELPGFMQRVECDTKLAPHLVADLNAEVLRVHARGGLRWKQVTNRPWQPRQLRRVPCHQGVCFHVEDEPL